ncbi:MULTISPECIES: conjugal transfer protein TraD [spotted fever group]|uniref:Conjugal transfer protein TraD n=1 Tax=Rickettsia tamurae subsp. buchneri TaxID=1462938 RepID=A0A8E0WML3_9RICK|nr:MULTISPECIES: conjugal transfer protein TraD [spotted fever group]EER22270.1 conjugative transfer protein [Rickettsia endosymbiont of Ixodes scapularis]KDO03416.1 Conjugal transfer protein TraD [Rickettsia tamurae subsp. buchneri]
MIDTPQQKQRLQQKKARLIMEEINFKIKERKMRTRHLIEVGGLVAKAELDNLPTNSLFGALVSLKNELTKYPDIQDHWRQIGRNIFEQEEKTSTAVILKFTSKPIESIRTHIRQHELKWNSLRKEWYGFITDMQSLKDGLLDIDYELEIVRKTE